MTVTKYPASFIIDVLAKSGDYNAKYAVMERD